MGTLWALGNDDYGVASSGANKIEAHIFGTLGLEQWAGYKGGRSYQNGSAAPTGAYSIFVR